MAKKYVIEPTSVLTLLVEFNKIIFIITDDCSVVKYMTHTNFNFKEKNYDIRQRVLHIVNNLITEYNVDMLLTEANSFILKTINRYPDPEILRNILLRYSIEISLEDYYMTKIKYLMRIPEMEWRECILNRFTNYSIDLYKSHILNIRNFTDRDLEQIDNNNYYKALCFTESLQYENLLNKKYQINYKMN